MATTNDRIATTLANEVRRRPVPCAESGAANSVDASARWTNHGLNNQRTITATSNPTANAIEACAFAPNTSAATQAMTPTMTTRHKPTASKRDTRSIASGAAASIAPTAVALLSAWPPCASSAMVADNQTEKPITLEDTVRKRKNVAITTNIAVKQMPA